MWIGESKYAVLQPRDMYLRHAGQIRRTSVDCELSLTPAMSDHCSLGLRMYWRSDKEWKAESAEAAISKPRHVTSSHELRWIGKQLISRQPHVARVLIGPHC